MLFYTPEFLAFSIILLAVLAVVNRDTPRKVVLLLASYIFYMWWNPAFVLLIMLSTGIDYVVGRLLDGETREKRRRLFLVVSLCSNLGLLAIFKYLGLFMESARFLAELSGQEVSWHVIHLTLPVGISFYTFQTLSYTLDVYRRVIPTTRNGLDFALFVAFFPQLVAGPIVRAADFLPQLRRKIKLHCDQRTLFLILRGLAKKVLIADNVGVFADAVFANPEQWPSLIIWVATIAFAVQIYCDFSGYSDIAIGIARVLGFELSLNFDHPYMARNPSDFWRRWHISLSSWLRDYLYVSMGGNRVGRFATYRNLMLTMLIGGLWHGASWNFVVWGFLHGLLLVVHRYYGELRRRFGASGKRSMGPIAMIASIAAMQYGVLLTWIAFRVQDFDQMWVAMKKFVIFDFDFAIAGLGLGGMSFFSTLLLLAVFFMLHLFSWRVGHIERFLGALSASWALGVCLALGCTAYFLWPLSEVPFIYFQF